MRNLIIFLQGGPLDGRTRLVPYGTRVLEVPNEHLGRISYAPPAERPWSTTWEYRGPTKRD
jgi:hypothetical protein